MDLSIIIVSYNTKGLLENCLFSIYQNNAEMDFEIIVIDNASQDSSVQMLKEKYPQVTLIENERNLGFAHANNQGIAQASGSHILFLNPDTLVLENTLKKTVEFMDDHPEAGVVGCKILNPDGTLQHSCRSFPSMYNYLFESTFLYKIFPKNRVMGRFYMTFFNHNAVKEVDVVLGAFLLLKREILEEVGGFDERFFVYSEETDFCYRVTRAGKKVLFFPDAQIIHYGGSSTSQDSIKMIQQEHKSRFLLLRKHHRPLTLWISMIIILLGVILRFILWSSVAGYCTVFNERKLPSVRKKMLTYSHLLWWYLGLGFRKESWGVSL